MKRGEPRFNVFERIESIKEILEPVVPNKDGFKIRGLALRCVKYRLGKISKLNKEEAKTYDLLLKNNLHPKRVYEWLLLEDVPKHIREKLEKNKISMDDARCQYVQWKRLAGSRMSDQLMEDIRNMARRLKWKSQEGV